MTHHASMHCDNGAFLKDKNDVSYMTTFHLIYQPWCHNWSMILSK